MSKNSLAGDAIRGGQQFTLEINMFFQNIRKHFKIVMFVSFIVFFSVVAFSHDEVDRKWAVVWAKSYFNTQIFKGNSEKYYTIKNGKMPVTMKWKDYYSHPEVIRRKDSFIDSIFFSGLVGITFSVIIIFFHVRYILRKGRRATEDYHKRGNFIAHPKDLKKQLDEYIQSLQKERGLPFLRLAGFDVPQSAECSGIAFCGSPGVGKSTEFYNVLEQFRSRRKKAIIYDKGGEFVSRFYREGKDIILNPFDARSASWDLWSEGKNEFVYKSMVNALIPETKTGDPIWYTAPRSVLLHVISEVGTLSNNPDIENVMRIVFRMDTKAMAKILRDTDAQAMFNTDAEKFAASIRGIIGTYSESLKYLDKSNETFSITEWVNDELDDSWLFISSTEEQADLLAPLMTVWLELFSKAFLTLIPSYQRKIGISLDELPTLNEIPSLLKVLNVGRKHGAVPLIGYQSPYQLYDKYGDKRAKTLLDAMSIYMAYRINGKDGAKESAEQLGEQEVEQGTEGYTVGQSDMRDATNVNRSSKDNRKLILGSEISALKDDYCYINFHRGFPISLVKINPGNHKPVVDGFIGKTIKPKVDPKTLKPLGEVKDIDEYFDEIEEQVRQEQEQLEQAMSDKAKKPITEKKEPSAFIS